MLHARRTLRTDRRIAAKNQSKSSARRRDCSHADVKAAMKYFARRDLHELSLVDATSVVLMRKHRVRVAYSFDTHFATAGFRLA